MRIDVIIATFGDPVWKDRAQARNEGARQSQADWLLFLDADDALDANYIAAMKSALFEHQDKDCLFRPSISYVAHNVIAPPTILPEYPILERNYMVIGTLVRRDIFIRVGGFYELLMYEDWDLWIRCILDGCLSQAVPQAIYQITTNDDGRNVQSKNVTRSTVNYIMACYWSDVYLEPLPKNTKRRHSFFKLKRHLTNFQQQIRSLFNV